MSSSYEYLSTGRYYDLSRLEKLDHQWDFGIRSKTLYINLKFLDMFLILQSFTTVCSGVTQKVQALFPYAAAEIQRVYNHWEIENMFYKLDQQIWEIKLEIIANYSFPEASLPLSSNVATHEFVKRFLDTVVMNLSDLIKEHDPNSWYSLPPCSSRQQMEEIVKELMLLRNFVCFISDRCTDPQSQHTFFTHVLVVAGHAAMISWLHLPRYRDQSKVLASAKMNASFSDLQMRIQPSQPCIRKIYVDVLQAIKSGCHPNNQAEHVGAYKVGLVETLIHHMEVIRPITDKHKERVAFKDQLTMLNFLRANLINSPREALEDFDTIIISVGILVYSMYDSVAAFGESNQETVLHLSGDIQRIQAQIYFLSRKSFCSNLPKIDGLGSLDIILNHLKEFLSRYSESLSSIRSQLWTIQQQLEHFQEQHDGFGSFAMQVIAKTYEVDHLVIGCINKEIPEWCLILWTGDIIEEVTKLMREVAEIHENKVSDLVLHNTIDVASAHTSEFSRITSTGEEMVGFEEVMDMLRRQLIRGSSHLDVISIVGMPGLGKTTLANKLFFDQLVVSHFDVRAQCCVSQAYTRKDLLLTILRGVKKDTVISDKLPENELADKLRKLLRVQRYLILIDDVWETAAWDDLYPCFCDANNGSRIILTTRLGDVASHAKLISDPHFLRLLTMEESWMLLKDKVFNTRSCPPVLEDVGQKIAQKCGGLPLSVVLVAGILEGIEKEKHCWEQVVINLGSHIQSKSEDIINLSYQELPFHLKPCFLYFGVFIEDEEIQVSKLTWLWTAEGLVKTHKEKHSEDIAEYYLKNLIGRNLVMVSKKSFDGKTKACRIHDLLLDFCKKKAKVENFLQCIKGDNDNMNPSSISHQKHSIPRRLCLYFQVKGIGGRVSLPDTLWKMVKLHHLHVYNRAIFPLPNVHEEHIKSPPEMNELRTLASAWFSCDEDANNILVKTPNLQKLRCEVLQCRGYSPAFNNLTKLDMLKFSWGRTGAWSTMLNLPPSLKKLTLSNGRLYSIGEVATLPRLVALKLIQVCFNSEVWEVTDDQFPHLKFLKLQDPSFLIWNVSDDAFPCLEHLVLIRMRHLEEIPSRFADMPTLKSVEVISCKESLVESAKDIEKTQVEEMQNCGFKLFIQK